MPVSEKSSGPSTLSTRHPPSRFIPSGICRSVQTMESSSGVRVIDEKMPDRAQAGISAAQVSRQIAKLSDNRERVSEDSLRSHYPPAGLAPHPPRYTL